VDRFTHTDWLGSARYLSDGTGLSLPSAMRYDGFGLRSAQSGPAHPSDFLFAAGWGYQEEYSDVTEPGLRLMYLEQRYYDPTVGAFLSPDPISYTGGLNLYSYVGNNPVGGIDPSGLAPWYDRLAGWAGARGEAAKNGVNSLTPAGLGGELAATAANTAVDVGMGFLASVSGFMHMGEATATEGWLGFGKDSLTAAGAVVPLARGLGPVVRGAAAGLSKVRWPNLRGCHRGSIDFFGGGGNKPPLKFMHPEDTIKRNPTFSDLNRQSTDDLVKSLGERAEHPLTVYPDGTIADGNTRVWILKSRGYDIDSLPRVTVGRSSGKPPF
jgi:RHS repeat-associated protein